MNPMLGITPEPLNQLLANENFGRVLQAREGLIRRLRADRVVCGLSAAVLWGLPVPASQTAMFSELPLHVTSMGGARSSRRSGTTGHELRLPTGHISLLEGVQLTSPPRTWLDCAALLEPKFLVAMGDAILRCRLASLVELEDVVAWAMRRRGVRLARLMLPLLDARAESPAESWLRWHMHEAGLPAPEPNVEVVIRGERVCRLDLAYRLLRLGIEYDGDWHAGTTSHDDDRRALLAAHGWHVIVVHKEDLADPGVAMGRIREAINSRTSRTRRW